MHLLQRSSPPRTLHALDLPTTPFSTASQFSKLRLLFSPCLLTQHSQWQAEYAAKLAWAKSHHLALSASKHSIRKFQLTQEPKRIKYEIEVPAGAKGGEMIHVMIPGQKKLHTIRLDTSRDALGCDSVHKTHALHTSPHTSHIQGDFYTLY